MEKEKKTTSTRKTAKSSPAKKSVVKTTAPKKDVKAEPIVEVKPEVKSDAAVKKSTLNQDLNVVVGFLSLLTILAFCFTFEGAGSSLTGWEIILQSKTYSGVFQGIMVLYVITLLVDCIMSVRVDTENDMFNTIQKAIYTLTLVVNLVVIAILITLISNISIGFIMFLIISIVCAIIKLVRIFVNC